METDIIIRKRKASALRRYHSEIKLYNKKENQIKFHIWQALKDRTQRFFKGCSVYGCDDLSWGSDYLSVYLNNDYNIAKDVMLFLEANEPLIALIGKGEYKFEHDQKFECYRYNYPKFKIIIYYGNGKCKKVKIAETSKVVKEAVYEVQCYD